MSHKSTELILLTYIRKGVQVCTMGRVYKKIYVDEKAYKDFKKAVKPLKVSQSLEIYMKVVAASGHQPFQALLDDMVTGYITVTKRSSEA